jgi:hypothetical protein
MTELSSADTEMRSPASAGGPTVKTTGPFSQWAQGSANFDLQQGDLSRDLPDPPPLFSGGCCHSS